MNYLKIIFSGIILIMTCLITLLVVSCEEVINIDLNSSQPVLSADGAIEKDSAGWIRISYTTDYFSTGSGRYVDDAIVSLSDNDGGIETFEYKGKGLYRGVTIKGELNKKYTIMISNPGFIYRASSELIEAPDILSVSYYESTYQRPGLSGKVYNVRLRFSEDPFNENYYNIVFLKNGIPDDAGYTLIRDNFYTYANAIEYTPRWRSFEAGDLVTVIVCSIDKNTYAYYSQLNDLLEAGMGGSSTPYNPVSNFGVQVLGFFRAYSSASFTSVVK